MNPENVLSVDDSGHKLIRLLRPSIVVLCGPAACGKSTFAERHFRPTQIISSDWARARVCDDEREQRFNAQAFALVHFLVEQRLTVNRLCVVDSTALTPTARKDLLDLAKKYNVPAVLILFDVPLGTCVERDRKRERSVGQAIIERQYQAFEQSKSTIRQEGFDQVAELKDSDLEKVQIEVLFRPIAWSGQKAQRLETATTSRAERPSRPFKPWSNGQIDRRRTSAPVVQPGQRRTTPGVMPPPADILSSSMTARSPAEPLARSSTNSPSPAKPNQPVSPVVANKPDMPSLQVASPKPAASAPAKAVPVGAQPPGGN